MTATTTPESQTTIEELVARIFARGGQISFSEGSKLPRVVGRISAEEYRRLAGNPEAVRKAVEALENDPWGAEAQGTEEEDIYTILRRWKEAYTAKGEYDWSIRNWMTDYLYDVLMGTAHGYEEKRECSLQEVHNDFRRWAEAHKTSYTVTVDGRQKRTVTPQIQPSTEDFNRMLRYLGVTREQYIDTVKPLPS